MLALKLKYTNAYFQHMKQANSTTKHTNVIFLHIGIWAAYWFLELSMFSLISLGFLVFDNFLFEILINLSSGTFLFYALILFALPAKAGRIQVFQLLWRLVLAFLVCMALRRGAMLLMSMWVGFESVAITNFKFFLVSGFDLFLKFGAYAALVWFFRRQGELQKQMLRKELEEEKLQRELLEARHAVLKAQINPHFLFNILNFIHSRAIAVDDQVIDKTVLLLSDILRHALRDSKSGQPILVDEELEHIEKLNELNKLRFNGKYYLNIRKEGMECRRKIPPFILLTFFENAMKYGVLNDPQHPVVLHILQSPHLLEIRLKNKIKDVESVDSRDQYAIGKRYIQNSLEQFHKNSSILEYQNDGLFHVVYLKITGE